jgi:hypothetical protein
MNVLLMNLYPRHVVDAESGYFCSANFVEEVAVTSATPIKPAGMLVNINSNKKVFFHGLISTIFNSLH